MEKSWIFLSVKEWEPCGGGIEKNDDDVQPSVGSGTVRIDQSVSWSDVVHSD